VARRHRRSQALPVETSDTSAVGPVTGRSIPRRGLTRALKNGLRLTLLAIVIAGVANSVLLYQAFGRSDEAPDNRVDQLLVTPVLAARRVPDLLVEIPGGAVLTARVDELFQNERMGPATQASCAIVRNAKRTLVSRSPEIPVIPASTMKVLTGTAALKVFGPNHQRETTVTASVAPANGVINGNLFFIGDGDPLLATSDYLQIFSRQPQAATSVEQLADAIAAAGITRITGDVVGDERLFDSTRTIDTWKPSYVANGEIGPISALSLNDGFTTLRQGERIARPGGSETGQAATQSERRQVWRRANEPAVTAANVLIGALQARNIAIDGTARVPAPDEPPATNKIASLKSLPMRDIVGQMLTESDNNSAEMLVKLMGTAPDQNGRPTRIGSWSNGIESMKVALSAAGVSTTSLTIVDGSGLDRNNRVTCAALMNAIEKSNDATRDLFPVAGETGTLANRMLGPEVKGRVRAKTGSLNGVAALAGDVSTQGGARLEFVMVLNELPEGVQGVATGDQLALTLAGYPRRVPGLRADGGGVSPPAAADGTTSGTTDGTTSAPTNASTNATTQTNATTTVPPGDAGTSTSVPPTTRPRTGRGLPVALNVDALTPRSDGALLPQPGADAEADTDAEPTPTTTGSGAATTTVG
jgi:serine-type D-Ala-D-Ala carboxypeptidase/endopeptidase (penicillin-binding protein 4)